MSSGGLFSSDERKIQFRRFLEQQVQYFMPFYPSLGPHLKYPLRYLIVPKDDPNLSEEESKMSEAVQDFRSDENNPKNLAKKIDASSWNMISESGEKRPFIITGGAGSGKTIFSGVLFSHLCEKFDAKQEDTLLLYSQLKDTRGPNLWARVIEGINHHAMDKSLNYYNFKKSIEYEGLQRTILIIDSLDEVSDFESDIEEVTSEMMEKGIFPVWTCREDNWDKTELDLVGREVLARVKVPPLDTRPSSTPDDIAEWWIILAFSKVPLLYTFKTNFELSEDLRDELGENLRAKLKQFHHELCANEGLANLDCRDPFPLEVWDDLSRKGNQIPVLTDILCDSMLEFLESRSSHLTDEIEDFLEQCAGSMNRSYRKRGGEVNEKTPSEIAGLLHESLHEDTLGLLKMIGILSERREQLRFSHRAFAEYVLWKYSPDDDEDRDERSGLPSLQQQKLRYGNYPDSQKCPDCPYFLMRELKGRRKSGTQMRRPHCSRCREDIKNFGMQKTMEQTEETQLIVEYIPFPLTKRDLTRERQFIMHWRKYLTPPYWEEEGEIDQKAMRGLLNRTGMFLSAILPLSKMAEQGSYGGYNLKQPWALSHQLWQELGGSLGFETGEDRSAQEHNVSREQVDAITADWNEIKPIQLQGYPGTGKTYSAVEVLLRKLTATDVVDKRALVLTLNRELSRDIQRDLTFKHGKSKNISKPHQVGDVVDRIDALSLDEIFQLWAPDLDYGKYVIEDSHLRERFTTLIKLVGDINIVHFKAAFTDFYRNMMDEWGDLIELDDYRKKSHLRRSISNSPDNDSAKADEVTEKWYEEIRHLLNVRISNHKACMILINRIMRLESKDYMADLPEDECLKKIDWTSGGGDSGKQSSEIIAELKAELSENPELHFYNMALVDEVQDMPPQAIILASIMANKRAHPTDLIFAGDHAQALKFDSFKWKSFFGSAKKQTEGIIKLIPESRPDKRTHLLYDLLKLHDQPDEIQELKENHRNPGKILTSMIDATWWNPMDQKEGDWGPTKSVAEIESLRQRNVNEGTVIIKQSETMVEYEQSLKRLLEHASTNARISIVICDEALEGFAESLSKTSSSINTEVFQISTIKGLERPTVIVLGGWMVSPNGEHPYVYKKNENFSGPPRVPKLAKYEIDRMNRRMLVALSRATETSVILVPPTGRRGNADDPFFNRHGSIFVQLPPPKIPKDDNSEYASDNLDDLITPDRDDEDQQHRDYQTAFYGVLERIDFVNRAAHRPSLQGQLRLNRLRVERLIEQEKTAIERTEEDGSNFLLTSLFQQLDNVEDLETSPLYNLLKLNRFSEDEESNIPTGERPRIPEILESYEGEDILPNHAEMLARIKSNPNVTEKPNTLSELISYAKLQNQILYAIWDLETDTLELGEYTEEEQGELRSSERRIREELSSLLEQITEESSEVFEDVGSGIINTMKERIFLPSTILKNDNLTEDEAEAIRTLLVAFNGCDPKEIRTNDELIYNLTSIAIAVINQSNSSGKIPDRASSKMFLEAFGDFMTAISSLAPTGSLLSNRLSEVALFARLPEFGVGPLSGTDTAKLFVEYANLSQRGKHPLISGWPNIPDKMQTKINLLVDDSIDIEGFEQKNEIMKERQEEEREKRTINSPEEKLIRLVDKHPEKEDFLLSLIKEDDFLPSLRGLSGIRQGEGVVELRATIIANIVKAFPEDAVSSLSLVNAFEDITEGLLNSERRTPQGSEVEGWEFEHNDDNVPFATKLPMLIRIAGNRRLTQSEGASGVQSSMLLTISLIKAGFELYGKPQMRQLNTLLGYVKRSPSAPNRVAEETAKTIRGKIDKEIDSIVSISGPPSKVDHREVSKLYYLWAAWMGLFRKPSLARKSEKLFSDLAKKYPLLPILGVNKSGRVHTKFYANQDVVWRELAFDNLQDYFVSSVMPAPNSSPKFTSAWRSRSFWGRPNNSFAPLEFDNSQAYSILRSLERHPFDNLTPNAGEYLLSESEDKLFEIFISIAKIIQDELTRIVEIKPKRKYIPAEALFSEITHKLRELQELAVNKDGMSPTELNKYLIVGNSNLGRKVHLTPQPDEGSGLSVPSVLTQRWGRTNQGFVIEILDRMGLEFDKNDRIQVEDIFLDDMQYYIYELETKFGYSVQQKSGAKPGIIRGSRPRSNTSEVLFHGSRLGCEHFLELDHIINSISQYIGSHNQYMRERIKGCDVRRLPYDRISVSLIVPELSEMDPEDLEKYLQRLQKSTEKDLGRSIELRVEVYLTPRGPALSYPSIPAQERVYTAQQNAHGNTIVCGDSIARNSYQIVFSGTYMECLHYKLSRDRAAHDLNE